MNNDPLQKQEGNLKNQNEISIENVSDIIRLAPVFISGVKRNQILIKTRNDYYIARDTLTNTIYICFKDLLTIDIDIHVKEVDKKKVDKKKLDDKQIDDKQLDDKQVDDKHIDYKQLDDKQLDDKVYDKKIMDHFSKLSETFRIYKTSRGYHVYCTSKRFPYRERGTIEYMLNNLCDKYYCIYCYIRGFSTRLNNKFNNEGKILYKYIGKTNGEEDDNLVKLVNLMERKSIKYKNDINFN
jgi:hypothetical protein